MKVKYYKEDNILVFKLSDKPYYYAEIEGDFVVHFTKDQKPVRIEILDARSFLKEASKALPKETRTKYFSQV